MLKRIVSFIVMVTTILIVVFTGVYNLAGFVGVKPYAILSGSMEPAIPIASVVFINMTDTYAESGDIIAFYDAGYKNKVVHRVKEVTEDGYVTKGDANDTIDLAILEQDRVIGAYLFHIPYAGYALEHKSLIVGFYVALLLIEYALPDTRKKEKSEEKEDGK